MERRRVLIIDDERELRTMLSSYLQAEGFETLEAADGQQGLESATKTEPDLIVLDVGLPGIDGFEVLRRLRQRSDVPVIMLTARAEEMDRVVGLTVGADDYVTKPFSPREVSARITAILRRSSMAMRSLDDAEPVLRFEGLTIDPARREVVRDGIPVEISTLEFDLLAALATSPGRVFSREQLMEKVWGWDYFGVDRVVDVHVVNIRKALGDDPAHPRFVGTVRGVGYKFVGDRL
ncbi:MAG: response regulator transcription factor [Acidimicrobiia bacterium]|nr:response regulator transcription factor [Acidimicrobiia bacterium]